VQAGGFSPFGMKCSALQLSGLGALLNAQEFVNRIANSRVELIDGAGHVPQWEQLEKVAPLVVNFLGEA
jgi:pimeloyl-ACP methyl ester carboxylesterase